jgi:hypothetical protein
MQAPVTDAERTDAMQNSGMAPQFSDGIRKTVAGKIPPKPAKAAPKKPAGKRGK